MRIKIMIVVALSLIMLGGTVCDEIPSVLEGASLTASAAETSGKCGDDLTWSYDEMTATLTISGTGDMYDYGYLDERSSWFDYRSNIRKIVVEDGCTRIGKLAFRSCTKLSKVELPDTLLSIGNSAFDGSLCVNCKIRIPDSVTSLDPSSFVNSQIGDINIPSGVTKIPDCSFMYTHLTSVIIPENVKKICTYAFVGKELQTVMIMDPDCEIEGKSFLNSGLYEGEGSYYPSKGTFTGVIYGYKDSTAQAYAEKNGITFKSIESISTSKGDLNDDGVVNISDAVILQKWLLSVPGVHMIRWQNADYNEDERLDVFDLCLMKRELLSFRFYRQPVGGKLSKDGEFTMTVEATGGSREYTYQWYKQSSRNRFASIEGATSPSYTANVASLYYCKVTDSEDNTISSDQVSVTPYYALEVFGGGYTTEIKDYKGAELLIGVEGGNAPYTFQWEKDGVVIDDPASNTADYYVHEPGTYVCTVTDADGSTAVSDAITVKDYEKLYIRDEQQDITLLGGTENVLPMRVGGGSGGWLWYYVDKDGEMIYSYGPSRNTSLGYTITEPGEYQFRINEYKYDSEPHQLLNPVQDGVVSGKFTVYEPVTFTKQPVSSELTDGSNTELSVAATGGKEPYTYQWQVNGEDIADADKPTCTFNIPGTYCCWVTDSNGVSVRSDLAKVSGNIQIIGQPYDVMLDDYYDTSYLECKAIGGEGKLLYTWEKWDNDKNDWSVAADASETGSLKVSGKDGGRYRCRVVDQGSGAVKTSDAVIVSSKMDITHFKEGDKLIFCVTGGVKPYDIDLEYLTIFYPPGGNAYTSMCSYNGYELVETTNGYNVVINDPYLGANRKVYNWNMKITDNYGQYVRDYAMVQALPEHY